MRFLPILAAFALQAAYLVSAKTPGVCWEECNDAKLELDMVGKDAACKSGSAFRVNLDNCKACADSHGGDLSDFPDVKNACA